MTAQPVITILKSVVWFLIGGAIGGSIGVMYGKKEQQALDSQIAIEQQERINDAQSKIIRDLRDGSNIDFLRKHTR